MHPLMHDHYRPAFGDPPGLEIGRTVPSRNSKQLFSGAPCCEMANAYRYKTGGFRMP